MLHYHVDNNLHKSWNIDDNFNWLIIYHFGYAINNDKNRVIIIALSVSG